MASATTDLGGSLATSSRQDVAIFESYGWADAQEIAQRLKGSLEEAGYDVWIDRENLRPDDEHFWLALEGALNRCTLVVALLSPHSVRLDGEASTPHGASVCHYELMLAVRKEKTVLPIVVVECDTPLAIIRYEPLHFTAWEKSPSAYREGVDEIIRAIQNIRAGDRRYVIYVDKLAPYDFFAELKTAAGSFVGREWVLARIEDWLPTERRCFLIEADPGSGKTALLAEMVRRNEGARVIAYHFCSALKPDTVNARMFVRFIAAMLCGTVPAYAERLRRSEDLVSALKSNDPTTMLSQGVLAALHAIRMEGTRYILVDALDEAIAGANSGGQMTIVQLLARAIGEFPSWLRLIVTTRRDDRVLPLFQDADRCFLGGAVAAQRDDVRNYIERRFAELRLSTLVGPDEETKRRAVAAIADRAAGSFQYAETVLNEIRSGELHLDELDHLPKELGSLYYRFADRRFPGPTDFRVARSVLSVLLAAREPLTRAQLQSITRLDRDEVAATLDALSCFLTWDLGAEEDRVYRTAHKSVGDWLIRPPENIDRFKVALAAGRESILTYCQNWTAHRERYALTHLIAHLLESGDVAGALTAIRGGFFAARHGVVDPRFDLDDTQAVVAALVIAENQEAIVWLSRTDDEWQRDGVAAALSVAPARADKFVDRIVDVLLRVR